MTAPALQLELPDPEPGGIWPWIVALLAACALPFVLFERLGDIGDTLEREVGERVARAGAVGVEVSLDGRDVTLAGELDPAFDRAALVAAVAAVDGVRVVRDELVVVDPAVRLHEARERFREALAGIDTSALTFEPGSASLTDEADEAIVALVRLLNEAPAFRIRIAGHTDDTGRAPVNVRISRERAEAVATRLAMRGIDPARLIAKGYGSTQPVADNATESGRARNRRIEISYVD